MRCSIHIGDCMVRTNASVQQYALTTTPIMVDLRSAGRVVIRVSGADVRFGLDPFQTENGTDFFLFADNTVAIFDPPNLFGDANWVATNAGTATLYVWKQGVSE